MVQLHGCMERKELCPLLPTPHLRALLGFHGESPYSLWFVKQNTVRLTCTSAADRSLPTPSCLHCFLRAEPSLFPDHRTSGVVKWLSVAHAFCRFDADTGIVFFYHTHEFKTTACDWCLPTCTDVCFQDVCCVPLAHLLGVLGEMGTVSSPGRSAGVQKPPEWWHLMTDKGACQTYLRIMRVHTNAQGEIYNLAGGWVSC